MMTVFTRDPRARGVRGYTDVVQFVVKRVGRAKECRWIRAMFIQFDDANGVKHLILLRGPFHLSLMALEF
ncbi:hypothetical protein KQX54_020065 [Cotesia glomerata]|uniref:Uncharacterized protein n=1 Tax=Cotesia glomerata TaxID=32391 RepID=A0AAV7HLT5_COTGL|nr:hypothetical protein KQX54_020065 [Cotesia glomerata]